MIKSLLRFFGLVPTVGPKSKWDDVNTIPPEPPRFKDWQPFKQNAWMKRSTAHWD